MDFLGDVTLSYILIHLNYQLFVSVSNKKIVKYYVPSSRFSFLCGCKISPKKTTTLHLTSKEQLYSNMLGEFMIYLRITSAFTYFTEVYNTNWSINTT